MKIAVVTGASSGLGKVFAQKVVERYPELDEIWLIARREERLKELAENYPDRKFRILTLDLTKPESFERLESELKECNPDIKVVINDAGFDRAGFFREMNVRDIYSIINLNATGTTMMCRCCLPYMKNGSYQILVGSEGAYLPLPMRAVYGSSKTYVRFLARAIREEENSRGVNILFMGTGAMNTEMFNENTPKDDNSKVKFLDLDKITVEAMKHAEKGAAVYSPGLHTKGARVLGKIFPSAISVKFAGVSGFEPKE